MRSFSVAVLALCLGSSSAFAPVNNVAPTATALNAEKNGIQKFAASAVASAFLVSSIFGADAAFAAPMMDNNAADFGGSTVTLAGRSGGRAGGRASSAARPSSSSSSSYRAPTQQTVIKKTTVIQQAPNVVVAPPPVYGGGYGGGYAAPPGPGLGTFMTLGAIDAVGDAMRENRINNEIRSTKNELQNEKMKEMELENRIRQMEMNQMQMAGRQAQAPPPQIIYQQAPPAQVVAP